MRPAFTRLDNFQDLELGSLTAAERRSLGGQKPVHATLRSACTSSRVSPDLTKEVNQCLSVPAARV